MIRHFISTVSLLCMFVMPTDAKQTADDVVRVIDDRQDRPSASLTNPLQGLTRFLFFPLVPFQTKEMEKKVQDVVKQQLQKYGLVEQTSILKKTKQREAVDLTPFANSSTLIYQIAQLSSVQGQELGLIRASLNASTRVTIDKTQYQCAPYIWSANCFVKGAISKDLDSIISISLRNLLEQFMKDFSLVNQDKPIFDLQGSD
ncbi:MAG: hypothetical protein RLZZ453_1042 [Chlamydiota bacterium]